MHGDFTRWTFRPDHAYRSVFLQQGRVLLDAEWNEQTEITAHHDEVRAADTVGRTGGPAPAAGGGPGPFAIREFHGSEPVDVLWTDLVVTGPGTYYVDGLLAEAVEPPRTGERTAHGWPLVDQPHLPAIREGGGAVPGLAEPEPADGDRFALYLDVWTHHVTADEDPALQETALGGPDTTTRGRTVWQVRHAPVADDVRCPDLHAAGWLHREQPRMVAFLKADETDPDPCRITTTGDYRRLENQLYRVQLHTPRRGSTKPTFLWSRENGSVVAGLTGIKPGPVPPGPTGAVLVLDRQGRDEELQFVPGSLVEVTSTDVQLRGEPGFLARVTAVDGLELRVEWLDTGRVPASVDALGRTPIARRWEGGPLTATEAAAGEPLEDNIFVRFSSTAGATGDHWLIPARSVRAAFGIDAVSGTIEWPRERLADGTPGPPLPQEPVGVRHHVAPLAILTRTAGRWSLESDCRLLFPSLTELVTIDLVGGDGQEAMPPEALPRPVRVAVRNGGRPVPGAHVFFTCDSGQLDAGARPTGPAPSPIGPSRVRARTGADGVAEVFWRLDPAGRTTQTLTARRVDAHDRDLDVPVTVTGRLSVAGEVAWRPRCDGFAGTRTVQDALDQLATTLDLRLLGGDGQHVVRGGDVVPQPVRVVVDSPCGPVAGETVVAVAGTDGGLVAVARPGDATPGTLTGAGGPDAAAETDADGVAAFFWQPTFPAPATSAVIDVLVKGRDETPLRVSAQLLPTAGRRPPGVHVMELWFPATGQGTPFQNDSQISPEQLASGIVVELDADIDPASVKDKPVARVVLDLPWPVAEDGRQWSRVPIGTRPVELLARCAGGGPRLLWSPVTETAEWLTQQLAGFLADSRWQLTGWFVLDGWAVVGADPRLHVNGHAEAVLEGGRTRLKPTDDEVTGGVFTQWFRLGDSSVVESGRVLTPDLTGLELATAKAEILRVGLEAGTTVEERHPLLRKGLVVGTNPAAGRVVPVGTALNLRVSSGRFPVRRARPR